MGAYVLNIVTMGEPEVGLWCDGCMLPAAWRLTFAVETPGSETCPSRLQHVTACFNCGPS